MLARDVSQHRVIHDRAQAAPQRLGICHAERAQKGREEAELENVLGPDAGDEAAEFGVAVGAEKRERRDQRPDAYARDEFEFGLVAGLAPTSEQPGGEGAVRSAPRQRERLDRDALGRPPRRHPASAQFALDRDPRRLDLSRRQVVAPTAHRRQAGRRRFGVELGRRRRRGHVNPVRAAGKEDRRDESREQARPRRHARAFRKARPGIAPNRRDRAPGAPIADVADPGLVGAARIMRTWC